MSKTVDVCVNTFDSILELAIQKKANGGELFEAVVNTIGLREEWFFGLKFVDTSGCEKWLKFDESVTKQYASKDFHLQFEFRVKLFPEDMANDIIDDFTLKLFYLQLKSSVLSDEIECPLDASLLLASFALQAEYGDYDSKDYSSDYLINDELLPKQVNSNEMDWKSIITMWWTEHKGLSRYEAIREYLRVVQSLKAYGIEYFNAKNKRGTDLWLGVSARGIHICKLDDKSSPEVELTWKEIRKFSLKSNSFILKLIDKKIPKIVLKVSKSELNQVIVELCCGYSEFSEKKLKLETVIIREMRAQVIHERNERKQEREILRKAIEDRELSEQRVREYDERVNQMQEKMAEMNDEINSNLKIIEKLTAQLSELEASKKQVEINNNEMVERIFAFR